MRSIHNYDQRQYSGQRHKKNKEAECNGSGISGLLSKCSIWVLIFFISLLVIPAFAATQEEPKEVIAIGLGDGSSLQGRDTAISDALRQAVAQGVGTFISSETVIQNMTLVEDHIYSESRGYIKSYKIIKEGEKNGNYEVKISALVEMGKLADDLESIGLLFRKKQNPRVMVALYSKEVTGSYFGVITDGNRNAENQIESSMLKKGFKLVDADQVKRKKELEILLSKNDLSMAGKIAKDYGAEVMVVGNVRRSFVNFRRLFGTNVPFFSNEIRLKALETDTAKLLFSGFRTRPPSGRDALVYIEEATSELVEEMVSNIIEQWRKDVYQAGTYQLNLSEASFKDISMLKKGLKNVRGVGEIQTRSFQSGIALIEITFKGTLEELAERISDIEAPRLNIVGLQSNTIEIKVGK